MSVQEQLPPAPLKIEDRLARLEEDLRSLRQDIDVRGIVEDLERIHCAALHGHEMTRDPGFENIMEMAEGTLRSLKGKTIKLALERREARLITALLRQHICRRSFHLDPPDWLQELLGSFKRIDETLSEREKTATTS